MQQIAIIYSSLSDNFRKGVQGMHVMKYFAPGPAPGKTLPGNTNLFLVPGYKALHSIGSPKHNKPYYRKGQNLLEERKIP